MKNKVISINIYPSSFGAVDHGWLAKVGFTMQAITLYLKRDSTST